MTHAHLFWCTPTTNSCQHQHDKPQLHCWLLFSLFSTLHSMFFRLIVSPTSFTPQSEHCPGRHYLSCMQHTPNLFLSFPPFYHFVSRVKQETRISVSQSNQVCSTLFSEVVATCFFSRFRLRVCYLDTHNTVHYPSISEVSKFRFIWQKWMLLFRVWH